MKEFRALLFIVLLAILIGCGADNGKDTTAKTPADQSQMTEKEKLMASMTELIERLMEGDKTVLYENEFDYYKDEVSLSEYMEIPHVIDYDYDTLRGIEFDTLVILGDSAVINAEVHYESKAGGDISRVYQFKMYNFHGKWIKPYMSKVRLEREYMEQQRIYDSAAAAEAAEQGD